MTRCPYGIILFTQENNWAFYFLTVTNVTSIKNSNLTVDGVTLNFANCVEMDTVNLTAVNGGVLRFPKLEKYTQPTWTSITWQATGAGSLLEFSALATLDCGASYSSFNIKANSGSKIDLSKVTSMTFAQLTSEGTGSVIDISGLTDLENLGAGVTFTEKNDGKIAYYTSNRLTFSVPMTLIPENAGTQAAQGTVSRTVRSRG